MHHRHFFNFRLDLDVDGAAGNSVVELDTEPAKDDPQRRAFVMRETVLGAEREAQRHLDLARHRKWKVINPAVRNALGHPMGYMLVLGESAVPLAAADSWVRKRVGFLNAHLWVTPYDPGENHAAGPYPNQSKGGEGLPKWSAANRPLANRDAVLWYTMGVTHIPRPEEWPVMTVHKTGFRLIPNGFFAQNPTLDVPRSQ